MAVPTSDRRLCSQAVPPGSDGTVGALLAAPVRPLLPPDAGGAAKIPRPSSLASDSTPAVDPRQHPALPDAKGVVGEILAEPPRLPLHTDAGGSAKIPRSSPTSTSTSTVDPRRHPGPAEVAPAAGSLSVPHHVNARSIAEESSSITPPATSPVIGRLHVDKNFSVGSASTNKPPTYDEAPITMFLAQHTPDSASPNFS